VQSRRTFKRSGRRGPEGLKNMKREKKLTTSESHRVGKPWGLGQKNVQQKGGEEKSQHGKVGVVRKRGMPMQFTGNRLGARSQRNSGGMKLVKRGVEEAE